jgi:hypothetical protein
VIQGSASVRLESFPDVEHEDTVAGCEESLGTRRSGRSRADYNIHVEVGLT